ncbi:MULTISPECIES: hypothetical protein [unclassified Streptomyces]|uniref:hypothetical protein n=1 Tax=unclassified Streptomyces TaxID=2593676 RepID=UPI003D8D9010
MEEHAHATPESEAGAMAKHRVIVYPPSETGGRRVRIDGVILGTAYSLQDLSVFLCRAGIEGWTEVNPLVEDIVESYADLIEWRGGGPDIWER